MRQINLPAYDLTNLGALIPKMYLVFRSNKYLFNFTRTFLFPAAEKFKGMPFPARRTQNHRTTSKKLSGSSWCLGRAFNLSSNGINRIQFCAYT